MTLHLSKEEMFDEMFIETIVIHELRIQITTMSTQCQ